MSHHTTHHSIADREFDFGGVSARLKEQRTNQMRNALHHYQLAVAALEQARKAENAARNDRDHWFKQVRELMGQGDRIVVGDLLITRHGNGGLQIEPVQVLGLL